ncbi:LamG domain-containing protein [Caloramator sp. E03]|uniref:LamG-like jellyroll fold domain-containing protein n=1 Tax=Caloramator sp. E03 TaxID=2576307 RepID=UPI0011107FA3|nr:LamG-like jellyroll fold domain-containing protein [Caloramator sp. E03]QCX32448.1 LamG domain-containing protein [Caloramator sp. E03]
MKIPTAGILNPQEGTIEFRVKPLVLKDWNNYFYMLTSNGRFLLFFCANGSACFDYGPDNSGVFTSSNIIRVNNWHYIALRWSVTIGKQALFVNGIKYEKNLPNGVATSFPSTVSIVNNYSALIDTLRISNRTRTDEEIMEAYQSEQALPVDEWTTYKLNFDNNLNFGQGGYYISPEFDLSAVGTAATSAISWQEDADGIQRTVYAKLDNQTNWVEVINGGKLPINAGDLLTGRKLQLKTKLLKVV